MWPYLLAALWLLWKALRTGPGKDTTDRLTKSQRLVRTEAIQWVLDAGKDLLRPVADFAGNLLGAHTAKDPLLAAYSDFLSVAKEAGRSEEPHETPMEFGEALASFFGSLSADHFCVQRLL